MRVTRVYPLTAALAFLCVGLQAAGGAANFAPVSAEDARRELAGIDQFDTTAAMWVWTDKYVYQPGQTLTVRWTVKPHNDFFPYTLVAYRQNNQTGVKTYLPGGGAEAADILGNTLAQGFAINRLQPVEKAVLAAVTVPSELGMHTIVVQLRDFTGTRIVKAAYFKFGVVDGEVNVSGNIDASATWVNTKAYRVSGLVHVRNNAVLTIEPGTFVIGMPGSQPPSAIVVTRTGRIVASGTRSRPIILTSSQPFGQRKPGDWGGLILLGRATNNWPTGEGPIEGLPDSPDSRYGGNDDTHDCGALRYVRVEFAGAEFQPNNEVNGITWGSCGTRTVSEYLQVSYGFDDAFEWFGGTNNAKYLVGTYSRDDYFDGQIGWRGKVQHAVALVNRDNANRGFEMDNNETNHALLPLGTPKFYNVTLVGAGHLFTQSADEGTGVAGVFLRRGAGGIYNNLLVYNWITAGIDFRDSRTLDNLDSRDLTMDGVILWDNGKSANKANTLEDQVTAAVLPFVSGQRGQARNVLVADPMLRRPLEYSDPDFRPRLGSPVFRANWVQPPDDGFFDQWATWSGAFGDVNWTEEWTNFIQEEDLQVQ
jgi:hypothetical protein